MNDNKIILYQQGSIQDVPTLLITIKAIEASLIQKLADYYNEPVWIEISEELLLVKRLHAEKRSYMKSGESIVFDVLREMPLMTRSVGMFPFRKRKNRYASNSISA
ncbi:heptaprenyl diphosphate synthase component 1 [[Brevibacterium] frigoritolerans]|uniref:Heptaprenyl diphosphate synthase component 1 n=1 Tax=Peribacillus frigoritolerans TaxID=450367 RepID=A0A941FMC0_9BACI|nr:heptaprenyl diphosphate synthase component 1 [Peribacillus frigoritolerans]